MSAALPDFYPALVARIRARLRPDPDRAGCLVYPSNGGRHARINFRKKLYSPHRVMLEAKLGHLLGQGEYACHVCDNPPCCADAHLWLGTPAANAQDAVAKGRMKPPVPTAEHRASIAERNRRRAQTQCVGCGRFVRGTCAQCGDGTGPGLSDIRDWLAARRATPSREVSR